MFHTGLGRYITVKVKVRRLLMKTIINDLMYGTSQCVREEKVCFGIF